MLRSTFAAVLICLSLFSAQASAVIITGDVTGGTALEAGGGFVELTELAGLSVGHDDFDDPNLYAFNERQNVVSDVGIRTDLGRDVRAGEVVASHYVAFDPKKASIQGSVTFDAPIIGVAFKTDTMAGSDFLMNGDVLYQSPRARGLESDDAIWIDEDDLTTLVLSFYASSPGDFVRVFTELSKGAAEKGLSELPVPLPPAFFVFAAALAGGMGTRKLAMGAR
ncbi:MAG: hypothetical protein V2I43_20375 [Parvularcula sp.]|nr:hypothetical protein [Parvularcula sp.]